MDQTVDPGLIASFIKILTDLGLPGLIIGALAWHDWQVQKRNIALNDTLLKVTENYATATATMTASLNRIGDMILRGKAPE